jgi:hypothetical protein
MVKKTLKTMAIVAHNPKVRKTIYKMLHHTTKLPIYVGQASNDANRASKENVSVSVSVRVSVRVCVGACVRVRKRGVGPR